MPTGLIVTHWSLLAIAIISSCFLFYFVASENAKQTTLNSHPSQEAVDFAKSKLPLKIAANDVAATAAAAKAEAAAAEIIDENLVKASTKGKTKAKERKQELIRDYKKVKKSKPIRTQVEQATSSSTLSPATKNVFIDNKQRTTDVSDLRGGRKKSFIPKSSSSSTTVDDDVDDNTKIPNSVDNSNYNANEANEGEHQRVNGDNNDSAGDKNNNIMSKLFKNIAQNENGESSSSLEDGNKATVDVAHEEVEEGLPNIITDIPAVTVTELPLEVLQPMQGSLNAILVDASKKKTEEQEAENRSIEILEENVKEIPPDEQIVKIDDSGGDASTSAEAALPMLVTSESLPVKVSSENESISADETLPELKQQGQQQENATATADDDSRSTTLNLTSEEVPMPVFSEWAQKQMEAAEKQQQAKEQEVVNTIAQKKNLTNGSKKLPTLKMRTKNYASPDCGAKIIASNSDASNTGAVLSSSKDEYMLSPCGNRIWFVVELCEAIQAQKVDLANFELFSSSPKNFTVAVANRFPTRDWSNVGRFVAEDKRNVQSFDLHPHLFGKFVRVDIHSHYSQEHFCPVSLFRVYGTSEIEAFDTENHLDEDDLDDFDVEFDSGGVAVDKPNNKKNTENIFKSASDAVLSIVKKAAEVLVKPASNQNNATNVQAKLLASSHGGGSLCRTSKNGLFSCNECTPLLVERVNDIVSCQFRQLDSLLTIKSLRNDLLSTQICSKRFGVEVKPFNNDCTLLGSADLSVLDVKRSYFVNLLPEEFLGALCHTLSVTSLGTNGALDSTLDGQGKEKGIALNLTIEKKLQTTDGDFKTLKDTDKLFVKSEEAHLAPLVHDSAEKLATTESAEQVTAKPTITDTTPAPIQAETEKQAETSAEQSIEQPREEPNVQQATNVPDVNIYNVPVIEKPQLIETEKQTSEEIGSGGGGGGGGAAIKGSGDDSVEYLNTELPLMAASTTETPPKNEEEIAANSAWENLDTLLPTTMSTGQVAQNNQQQKLPGSPQSESVFIRLSNRIKTLERNMSLSGQYLEELSRRYKKQVEELQQTLTQQTQNVRNLEEQNRRHIELQQLYEQNLLLLRNEVDNMALQVHATIVVIIVVGAFVLLLIVISTLFYRAIWQRSRSTLQRTESGSPAKKDNCNQKRLSKPRRKSFDDLSDHGQEKLRRPSEEAMDILKNHLDVPDKHRFHVDKMVQTQPQRKISVCYSGGGSVAPALAAAAVTKIKNKTVKSKGAKHSWSNPNDTRQIDLEELEELRGMDLTFSEYQQIMEAEKLNNSKSKSFDQSTTNQQLPNGQGKSKKKNHNLRRQDSAPAQCIANVAAKVKKPKNQPNEFAENLILDEEDLDNFIPNCDLAYNEFMPEGPSGYQTVIDDDDEGDRNCNEPQYANVAEIAAELNTTRSQLESEKSAKNKKQRRLSSTGFFKSPFGKALKAGKQNSNNDGGASATSWEWHRLRNSSTKANQLFRRSSPTGSLDASTLSEIHFPNDSANSNSFRILEEAILSSGEAIDDGDRSPTTTKLTKSRNSGSGNNGKQSRHSTASSISSGGSAASNSSQRSSISNSHSHSTTSSTTTAAAAALDASAHAVKHKKQRSFNRIFRKVF